MAVLQQPTIRYRLSRRTLLPIAGGLSALLLIVATGNSLWMSATVGALVGIGILSRIGPLGILYIYAGLMWLLPRLYLPGTEALIPIHFLLVAGAVVLWLVSYFIIGDSPRQVMLPPFWPLVLIYAVGGVVGFFKGRADIDPTNGLKFMAEACLLAPVLYLLVWQYVRSTKDGERLVLTLAASTLLIGAIAYVFQGSGYWTPIPFEKEGLRLSGQYQFGSLYLIVTPVLMSTQLSMLIPALASLGFNSESKWHRIAAVALIVPLTLIILLAAGRSGWMGTIAGLLVAVFFSVRAGKISLPKLGVGVFVVLFLGALAIGSMGVMNEEVARRLLSFSNLLDDDTVVFRYWIWGLGIDLVQHYPQGVGFQAIRGLYGYPAHNSYILWALGTGVAGFAALLGFLIAWLTILTRTVFRNRALQNAPWLGALAGVVGGLISINGDNISSSVGWTQSTLWILLGVGASMMVSSFKSQVDVQANLKLET